MPSKFFLSTIKITDIIDILIVSYLVYKIIVFFKNTRGFQLLKGIFLLLVISQLSDFMQLNTITFLLKNTLQLGLIALVILFQPEIRKALSKMGSKRFKFFNFEENVYENENNFIVKQIKDACHSLTKLGYGALIVIERDIKIEDIIKTGIKVDSAITSELLVNIFVPNTPLHDGAVVIGDRKIRAAACFLPLSQNESISNELGTRHRAGIGISESSDAVAVIVSEETKKVSVAIEGALTRNLSEQTLETVLKKALSNELGTKNKRIWRFIKNEK